MLSESDIRDRFRMFDTRLSADPLTVPPGLRKASVLIPLFLKNGEWRILLTQRTAHLRAHSGNVAFPGGKQDEGDANEIAAALREAEEEIGLRPEDVRIVAVFPPCYVDYNNGVTSMLGIIPADFVPKINIDEVEKVFDLPLSRFLESDFTMQKMPFHGEKVCVYSFVDKVDGWRMVTWGFTAMYCMIVALVTFQSDMRMEFIEGASITKDEAFDTKYNFLNLVPDERNVSKL